MNEGKLLKTRHIRNKPKKVVLPKMTLYCKSCKKETPHFVGIILISICVICGLFGSVPESKFKELDVLLGTSWIETTHLKRHTREHKMVKINAE